MVLLTGGEVTDRHWQICLGAWGQRWAVFGGSGE